MAHLCLKKRLLDICLAFSRGLSWFGCHYLPPFSRRFALAAAPTVAIAKTWVELGGAS
ncbi:hypothetical protein SBV1_170030 [Verrucomicrobia bacterium]|nr:hypothetical protein SBV1_170030 [Verrucomicrobiota bacterium]